MVAAHHRDPGDFAAAARAAPLFDDLPDFGDPLDNWDRLVAKIADESQDVGPEGRHRDRVGLGPRAVDVADHGDAEDAARPVGAGQQVEELAGLGRGGAPRSELGLEVARRRRRRHRNYVSSSPVRWLCPASLGQGEQQRARSGQLDAAAHEC